MNFADAQEARDFLAAHPEVRSIELLLIDANGVPRGKLLHCDELPATPADPRHALERVIERLQADGYQPVMAVELEFYLLDRSRDAQGRPQPALQMNGVRPGSPQVYGVYELEQLQPFLDDLYAACEVQGLPVRTAISEYAPGSSN